MLLHVSRTGSGVRRLVEIAVLQTAADARVRTVTAWHADTGSGCGADDLHRLIASRART